MNSITSPNVFGSAALIAAYDESEEWLDQITDYLRESYTYMSDFITKKMPSWKLMTMEASYLPGLTSLTLATLPLKLLRICHAKPAL